MLKISDAVYEILTSSNLALEAMRSGLLNLSAYAEQIHKEVEEKTWKEVKKTTIVVALSRLAKQMEQIKPLTPHIYLDELSIKSPLCDVTFEKTSQNLEKARLLAHHLGQNTSQFFDHHPRHE